MDDKLKSLYVDMPTWSPGVQQDDFIITIGKTKSNSVYHVYKSRMKLRPNVRVARYYLKVLKSDLITALQRDPDQQLIPMQWYSRNKR